MAIRPCPNSTQCPDDVFGNLSVEEPDPIDYISTQFASFPPPLLPKGPETWSATECGQTFVSTVSQFDADIQAAAAAILCNFHQENPGVNPIYNTPEGSKCCVKCPDGLEFCYTVPAIFGALNLAQANEIAHQQACILAKANRICLSDLPTQICQNQAFNKTVTADGALGICTWTIEDGNLPDGLLLRGVATHIATTLDNKLPITGTPTTVGTFNFTLRCTGENGSFMDKPYTIVVNSCSATICVLFDVSFVGGVNSQYNPVTPWDGKIIVGSFGTGSAFGAVTIPCNDTSHVSIQVKNGIGGASDWQVIWFWSGDFVLRSAQGFFVSTNPFGGYQWVPLTPPPGIPTAWNIGPC